jgi:excisionase family DNA binding protein
MESMRKISPRLTQGELEAAFGQDSTVGPVLTTAAVAVLLSVSKKTVDEWVARGYLDGTFRKRGKHRLFLRDRVLDRVFNGPEWNRVEKE